VRLLAPLDEFADSGDTGGTQELPELGELLEVTVGPSADQIRPLAGTPAAMIAVAIAISALGASVAASLHELPW
jgi:hypothetical protein